jgi:hypothetical protein
MKGTMLWFDKPKDFGCILSEHGERLSSTVTASPIELRPSAAAHGCRSG